MVVLVEVAKETLLRFLCIIKIQKGVCSGLGKLPKEIVTCAANTGIFVREWLYSNDESRNFWRIW